MRHRSVRAALRHGMMARFLVYHFGYLCVFAAVAVFQKLAFIVAGIGIKKNDMFDCGQFRELDAKGCYVILSNSHVDFIADLYNEFEQETVMARRAINCKVDYRGKVKELIIRNWKPEIARRNLVEEIVATY